MTWGGFNGAADLKYVFYINGTWDYFENDVKKGSGIVQLVSWPDYANTISFKLTDNGETVDLSYPWCLCFIRVNGIPIDFVARG
jgi:hypothetical protein